MTILVCAEHGDNELKPSTLNTLAAAQKIGGEIHLLVAGHNIDAIATAGAKIQGVSQVIKADHESLAHQLPEPLGALVADVGQAYEHILVSSSTIGKNFLPRVAALLDVGMMSDVMQVIDTKTYVRPIYAGNALATVESLDTKHLMTIRATGFDPVAAEGGSAEIKELSVNAQDFGSSFVKEDLAESDRPELTAAKVVISGGRGMQNGENFALLEGIADKLGAAIGASRAAVDAGFVPNDYQVGQTGKIVAPDLYIAVGISGAIQHLAGMKDSKVIVAINKDEEAPIFQIADYGLVADLFEALPQLEAAL